MFRPRSHANPAELAPGEDHDGVRDARVISHGQRRVEEGTRLARVRIASVAGVGLNLKGSQASQSVYLLEGGERKRRATTSPSTGPVP